MKVTKDIWLESLELLLFLLIVTIIIKRYGLYKLFHTHPLALRLLPEFLDLDIYLRAIIVFYLGLVQYTEGLSGNCLIPPVDE